MIRNLDERGFQLTECVASAVNFGKKVAVPNAESRRKKKLVKTPAASAIKTATVNWVSLLAGLRSTFESVVSDMGRPKREEGKPQDLTPRRACEQQRDTGRLELTRLGGRGRSLATS